jgi:hypothetical protein
MGLLRTLARPAVVFVRDRPRLRNWIGANLDRFPLLKSRVKRLAAQTMALGPQGSRAHRALDGSDLPRTTALVYAELNRVLDERAPPDGPRRP